MHKHNGAADLDTRLTMTLRDLGHMMRFLFERRGSQKRALTILNRTGGMTQRELTEQMNIQPGSASELIGKLESAGLILRTPSQTDRRTADIRLTPQGRSQAEEAIRQRKIRQEEMYACLTTEEKETLLALAEKLSQGAAVRFREWEREAEAEHGGKHSPPCHGGHCGPCR